MSTGNTTLLKLALPVEGELDGTWGDVVNDSITSLVDSAVAGTTQLTSDADVTLTDTALAANQSRQAVILWTASNSTTRNITAPARSKAYIVINAGTGSIVVRGAGPTTGVTVLSGTTATVARNGSDFVRIGGDVTITGTQTLTNKTLTNPTINNYVEGTVAIGTVTSSHTFNLTNGTVQTVTLTASTACTFTMPTPVAGKSFIALVRQAAVTGGGTATFTGVKWGVAGAPTITSTAGRMDIISFVSDGTNWYGSATQGYTP